MEADEVRALIQRSNAGDPAAMTEVGRRFLDGLQAPKSPGKGAALVLAAAQREWPEAVALSALLLALGLVGPPDWDAAVAQLHKAAALGDPGAAAQLAIVAVGEGPRAPSAEPVSASPRIWWLRGALSAAECGWLVGRARGRLERAGVYDGVAGELNLSQLRTNSLFAFTLAELDLVVLRVQFRLAKALGVDPRQLETANVLHYEPGQRFGRHGDFLTPNHPRFAEDLARNGQRVSTALAYLNDDYGGGETEFPALGRSLRGEVGDVLCFRNVDDDGRPATDSLHAGLAPVWGEKWLFSQFIRDKPQS